MDHTPYKRSHAHQDFKQDGMKLTNSDEKVFQTHHKHTAKSDSRIHTGNPAKVSDDVIQIVQDFQRPLDIVEFPPVINLCKRKSVLPAIGESIQFLSKSNNTSSDASMHSHINNDVSIEHQQTNETGFISNSSASSNTNSLGQPKTVTDDTSDCNEPAGPYSLNVAIGTSIDFNDESNTKDMRNTLCESHIFSQQSIPQVVHHMHPCQSDNTLSQNNLQPNKLSPRLAIQQHANNHGDNYIHQSVIDHASDESVHGHHSLDREDNQPTFHGLNHVSDQHIPDRDKLLLSPYPRRMDMSMLDGHNDLNHVSDQRIPDRDKLLLSPYPRRMDMSMLDGHNDLNHVSDQHIPDRDKLLLSPYPRRMDTSMLDGHSGQTNGLTTNNKNNSIRTSNNRPSPIPPMSCLDGVTDKPKTSHFYDPVNHIDLRKNERSLVNTSKRFMNVANFTGQIMRSRKSHQLPPILKRDHTLNMFRHKDQSSGNETVKCGPHENILGKHRLPQRSSMLHSTGEYRNSGHNSTKRFSVDHTTSERLNSPQSQNEDFHDVYDFQ